MAQRPYSVSLMVDGRCNLYWVEAGGEREALILALSKRLRLSLGDAEKYAESHKDDYAAKVAPRRRGDRYEPDESE